MTRDRCKCCSHRRYHLDDDPLLVAHGWFWCVIVEDMIHVSFSCSYRKKELESPRIPLAVRLGLIPNDQGEYMIG